MEVAREISTPVLFVIAVMFILISVANRKPDFAETVIDIRPTIGPYNMSDFTALSGDRSIEAKSSAKTSEPDENFYVKQFYPGYLTSYSMMRNLWQGLFY